MMQNLRVKNSMKKENSPATNTLCISCPANTKIKTKEEHFDWVRTSANSKKARRHMKSTERSQRSQRDIAIGMNSTTRSKRNWRKQDSSSPAHGPRQDSRK